jgi:hypothetical protein
MSAVSPVRCAMASIVGALLSGTISFYARRLPGSASIASCFHPAVIRPLACLAEIVIHARCHQRFASTTLQRIIPSSPKSATQVWPIVTGCMPVMAPVEMSVPDGSVIPSFAA